MTNETPDVDYKREFYALSLRVILAARAFAAGDRELEKRMLECSVSIVEGVDRDLFVGGVSPLVDGEVQPERKTESGASPG